MEFSIAEKDKNDLKTLSIELSFVKVKPGALAFPSSQPKLDTLKPWKNFDIQQKRLPLVVEFCSGS